MSLVKLHPDNKPYIRFEFTSVYEHCPYQQVIYGMGKETYIMGRGYLYEVEDFLENTMKIFMTSHSQGDRHLKDVKFEIVELAASTIETLKSHKSECGKYWILHDPAVVGGKFQVAAKMKQ